MADGLYETKPPRVSQQGLSPKEEKTGGGLVTKKVLPYNISLLANSIEKANTLMDYTATLTYIRYKEEEICIKITDDIKKEYTLVRLTPVTDHQTIQIIFKSNSRTEFEAQLKKLLNYEL